MPQLNELPGNITRKKFINAIKRLGFEVNMRGGNGSHYKVTYIKTQKSIVVPKKLEKQQLKYIIDEIENISDIRWEDIKKEL